MSRLPSLCGCACLQRTRKYCWPSPRGSGGSSGTTAGSELEVVRFCRCSPPPVALIRPSIRSSAAGRPTCCLRRRQTGEAGPLVPNHLVPQGIKNSSAGSMTAGTNQKSAAPCPFWNWIAHVWCQRMTGASFFASAGTISKATLAGRKCGRVAERTPTAIDWTGPDWIGLLESWNQDGWKQQEI